MRMRSALLILLGALSLGACSGSDTVAPIVQDESEALDLLPDYDISAASTIDGAGIGASLLPDSLKLTAEQKAAIKALHDAFRTAQKADLDALKAIEKEAREAIRAGQSRDQVKAILQKALPFQARLTIAFVKLQADIWNVYTPAQKAWIESHRPRICGPNGPPPLSDAQVAQIRALREAFMDAVKADFETIVAVAAEARAARQAGKSAAEIRLILDKAKEAHERIRAAERKLNADIDAVLTPAQRASRCLQIGPKPIIQLRNG